jgi:hypothetical protein
MKRHFTFSLVLVAAAFVFASASYGQQSRVLGGYKAIAKTDAAAKKAAEFAVKTQAEKSEKEIELVSVVKAERQSVAGSNYRMCLKITTEGAEGQDAAEVYVKVVVYVDLKQNYKLTSWEASDCGEDDDGD